MLVQKNQVMFLKKKKNVFERYFYKIEKMFNILTYSFSNIIEIPKVFLKRLELTELFNSFTLNQSFFFSLKISKLFTLQAKKIFKKNIYIFLNYLNLFQKKIIFQIKEEINA